MYTTVIYLSHSYCLLSEILDKRYNPNKYLREVITMLHGKMTKKEQILRLHQKGMKQVEIAKELKTYTNYVWKVINEQKGK